MVGPSQVIPTFANPFPAVEPIEKGKLGWACQGAMVDTCRNWLDKRIQGGCDDDKLEQALCFVCRPALVPKPRKVMS